MIARKWRPQTFNELIGQDHVSQTLLNALKSDRLPHALLFTGPRGTGKTSSARLLAKSIRCPNAKEFVPCNTCKDCEDISVGRSFDVFELDGASNNGVDAVRDLQEGVRTMPSSGRYKLYIIDEVHMLSISAFNALLKTLEEPPAHVIFILATTEVQKIPATILSRCQRFDFRRIPVRQVTEHLKHICKAEGVKHEEEGLWIIARQGGGSMRDSQSLLDQVITYTGGDLSQEKVVQILGLTDRGLLLETVKALSLREPARILDVIGKIFQSGHDPSVFAEDLLEEIRHLLLVKVNPKDVARIVDLPESEIDNLRELGKNLSEEDIHLLFDMTLKGCGDIVRASDPRLVLEMLLLRMVAAPKVQSLTALLAGAPPVAERKTAPAPTPAPSAPRPAPPPVRKAEPAPPSTAQPTPQPAAPVSAPAAKIALPAKNIFDMSKSENDNWFAFVQQIKLEDATMSAHLENTHIVGLADAELTLGLPESLQFLHDQFRNARFLESLGSFLKKYWARDLKVTVKAVKTNQANQTLSPREAAQKKQEEDDEKMRQAVEQHPLVQSAKQKFNAQVTKIKENS